MSYEDSYLDAQYEDRYYAPDERDVDVDYWEDEFDHATEDDRVFRYLTDDEDYSDADAVESDGDADAYWDEEMYDPSWR